MPGMNSLPLVCGVGGKGRAPGSVSVPRPGSGAPAQGHALAVAVRPASPECHPGSRGHWTCHCAGNPSGQWVPDVLMGRGSRCRGRAQASPHKSQGHGFLVVLWAQGGVRGTFLGEMHCKFPTVNLGWRGSYSGALTYWLPFGRIG